MTYRVTYEEIVEKIKNKESFYLGTINTYFNKDTLVITRSNSQGNPVSDKFNIFEEFTYEIRTLHENYGGDFNPSYELDIDSAQFLIPIRVDKSSRTNGPIELMENWFKTQGNYRTEATRYIIPVHIFETGIINTIIYDIRTHNCVYLALPLVSYLKCVNSKGITLTGQTIEGNTEEKELITTEQQGTKAMYDSQVLFSDENTVRYTQVISDEHGNLTGLHFRDSKEILDLDGIRSIKLPDVSVNKRQERTVLIGNIQKLENLLDFKYLPFIENKYLSLKGMDQISEKNIQLCRGYVLVVSEEQFNSELGTRLIGMMLRDYTLTVQVMENDYSLYSIFFEKPKYVFRNMVTTDADYVYLESYTCTPIVESRLHKVLADREYTNKKDLDTRALYQLCKQANIEVNTGDLEWAYEYVEVLTQSKVGIDLIRKQLVGLSE